MTDTDRPGFLRRLITAGSSLFSSGDENACTTITCSLEAVLEPSEEVLAYADRPLPESDTPAGVLDYPPAGGDAQTDAFAYAQTSSPESDALAYNEERGRQQPDVMGGAQQKTGADTDAFAYSAAVPSPATDAFKQAGGGLLPDVDVLLLTDRRIIRAVVEGGKATVLESALPDVAVTAVPAAEAGPGSEAPSVALYLPSSLRRLGEDARWEWRLPEGGYPSAVADDWNAALSRGRGDCPA